MNEPKDVLTMVVPETTTNTVLQQYPGNWAADNDVSIQDSNVFLTVGIDAANPEALRFMGKLREEAFRLQDVILGAADDGMERPPFFDSYGICHRWEIWGETVERSTVDLSGYIW